MRTVSSRLMTQNQINALREVIEHRAKQNERDAIEITRLEKILAADEESVARIESRPLVLQRSAS